MEKIVKKLQFQQFNFFNFDLLMFVIARQGQMSTGIRAMPERRHFN
jgi:hypothetical protein